MEGIGETAIAVRRRRAEADFGNALCGYAKEDAECMALSEGRSLGKDSGLVAISDIHSAWCARIAWLNVFDKRVSCIER